VSDRLVALLPVVQAALPVERGRLEPLVALLRELERPERAGNGYTHRKERERRLFSELDASLFALKRAGHAPVAAQLQTLRGVFALEASLRDEAWLNRQLLEHWDLNANGAWEPSEIDAYHRQVERMMVLAEREAASPRWYFRGEDDVHGPWPLTRVSGQRELPPLLVRYGSQTGWVRVADLLR